MGIIWNLSRGAATFRSLQSSCETISPSILNSRLKDLREAGLIARSEEGYVLTRMGQDLFQILKPFGDWSIKWAKHIGNEPDEHWEEYRKTDSET